MSEDTYQSDNSGNRAAIPEIANPVAASGISIAMATAGNDYTGAVVGGKQYIVSCDGGFVLLSITGVTSTAANREWMVQDGGKIIIKIPDGITTLYCESDTNSTTLYLAELA